MTSPIGLCVGVFARMDRAAHGSASSVTGSALSSRCFSITGVFHLSCVFGRDILPCEAALMVYEKLSADLV